MLPSDFVTLAQRLGDYFRDRAANDAPRKP